MTRNSDVDLRAHSAGIKSILISTLRLVVLLFGHFPETVEQSVGRCKLYKR
jgi:hypothetical protein